MLICWVTKGNNQPFVERVFGSVERAQHGKCECQQAAAEDAGERRSPVASFADSVATENIDELDDTNNNSNEAAGDEVFRRQMRATTKVKSHRNLVLMPKEEPRGHRPLHAGSRPGYRLCLVCMWNGLCAITPLNRSKCISYRLNVSIHEAQRAAERMGTRRVGRTQGLAG